MNGVAPKRSDRSGYRVLVLGGNPDLAALHAARPDRYPHWLASTAEGGGPNARYDILFAFPGITLTAAADGTLAVDGEPLGSQGGFLERFDALWREHAARFVDKAMPCKLPFTGGWFLFLSYELAQEIEPVLGELPGDAVLPRACAVRFPAAILRDHAQHRTLCVAEPGSAAVLEIMQRDLRAVSTQRNVHDEIKPAILKEEDPELFLHRVRRAKEYIAAGDVFQVNLSRAWRAQLARPVTPVTLHRRLAAANPAPFAALATFPGARAIVSSSPERLVEVRGRTIRTRPIAGTYPRSFDPGLDRAWSQELARHPKERAEHVMLIDLARNDLGRVCRVGSVRVSELMTVESYRHVHHLVSEIRGELREEITPAQVISAVFPGGTISGCPKVRSMQIIAALERAARGAYTGSLGYVNHDGSLDLNILIRTLVVDGTEVRLRAGSGIVADSVPERELAETRAKAHGLIAALSGRD